MAWALQHLGIQLCDSAAARSASGADDSELPVQWVLQVGAVTEAQVRDASSSANMCGHSAGRQCAALKASTPPPQVRAGAVAERVATEGVMLQYAVDTQLDLLLGRVYALLTTPPLPRNPWPRVLHLLRAHAARMELWKVRRCWRHAGCWQPPCKHANRLFVHASSTSSALLPPCHRVQEDAEDAVARMTNQLALLSASSFIYAATPPDAAAGRGWRGGGRARQGRAADDDDDGAAVYGCYAAVTLCDCRALQALAASLGALASERQVQQGGYSCEVLPALAGDAWLSGAAGAAAMQVQGSAAALAQCEQLGPCCRVPHCQACWDSTLKRKRLAAPGSRRARQRQGERAVLCCAAFAVVAAAERNPSLHTRTHTSCCMQVLPVRERALLCRPPGGAPPAVRAEHSKGGGTVCSRCGPSAVCASVLRLACHNFARACCTQAWQTTCLACTTTASTSCTK